MELAAADRSARCSPCLACLLPPIRPCGKAAPSHQPCRDAEKKAAPCHPAGVILGDPRAPSPGCPGWDQQAQPALGSVGTRGQGRDGAV